MFLIMDKVNEMEIPPKYKKLIDYYNKRLEIDPDSAIEKTRKKYSKGESRMYELAKQYSQTPSEYKKSVQDSKATALIIVDEELNKGYEGILTPDMALLIKSLKVRGIDVKSMVAEILQYLYRNKIGGLDGNTLLAIERNIPMKKTLKQEAEDVKYEAAIMKNKAEIRRLQTDIIGEEGAQYITKTGVQILKGDNQSDGNIYSSDGADNIIYDKDFEEMYNELTGIVLEASLPNINREYIEFRKTEFKLKWGFRMEKAKEIKQIKAKREAQLRANRERNIIEVDAEQELEELLEKPMSEIIEIYRREVDGI